MRPEEVRNSRSLHALGKFLQETARLEPVKVLCMKTLRVGMWGGVGGQSLCLPRLAVSIPACWHTRTETQSAASNLPTLESVQEEMLSESLGSFQHIHHGRSWMKAFREEARVQFPSNCDQLLFRSWIFNKSNKLWFLKILLLFCSFNLCCCPTLLFFYFIVMHLFVLIILGAICGSLFCGLPSFLPFRSLFTGNIEQS